MSKNVVAMLCTALLLSSGLYAQETVLVEIDKLSPRTLLSQAFALDRSQEVHIQATGLSTSRRHPFTTNAWILDAQTREVVWEMKEANTKRRDRTLRDFEGAVALPGGTYEVYYSSFSYFNDGFRVNDLGNALSYLYDQIFERDDRRPRDEWTEGNWSEGEYRREYEELGITVKGNGRKLDEKARQAFIDETKAGAVIDMSGLWDEDYKRQGFTLSQPTELQIYAIGEARYDNDFDYGWIIDVKTREKVWKFTYDNSKPAGGAEKNRMFKGGIELPAGSYAAIFVTDDSHSYRRWNSPPPYDPEFWGMVIRTSTAERANVRLYEYENLPKKNVFLELTRARDDEYLTKGFTLKQPLDVRVYALGEGRDGEMFDYGWILDAKTRRKVWNMDYRETEHAGGADKNRLADEVVRLEPGNYLVYYLTDGSHSYRDWNSSAPFEQERWGITLLAANENFDAASVADYTPEAEASVLAQIVNVRDDQHRQVSFSLDKSGEVRVYALGEGSEGDMFDYGWIEEARTGKVVWEMTYRMTEHAGGARKNRAYEGEVYLKAGEYELHYRTDGSHSAGDWNDDPPHDPAHWGVTVYRPE
jgi:hypothetical protein